MSAAETDLSQATGSGTDRLLAVVAQLRGENGCPWDREQTLDSLKPYLVEESYELLDAIENGDVPHHREELGDVLLQVEGRLALTEGIIPYLRTHTASAPEAANAVHTTPPTIIVTNMP